MFPPYVKAEFFKDALNGTRVVPYSTTGGVEKGKGSPSRNTLIGAAKVLREIAATKNRAIHREKINERRFIGSLLFSYCVDLRLPVYINTPTLSSAGGVWIDYVAKLLTRETNVTAAKKSVSFDTNARSWPRDHHGSEYPPLGHTLLW